MSHTAHRGGAELALARLLSAAPAWTASVVSPADGDAFAGLAGHGVGLDPRLPGLPTGGTRSRNPALAARYLAALRAGAAALRRSERFRAADVLHANTAAAAIVSALANRSARKPLVVHLRDLVTPESLGRFGHAAFTRLGLRHAHGVIANSASTLRSAAGQHGSDVPGAVIQSPAGITRRVAEPATRPAVRRVGMVGRLQHWKGQHVFLDAFATAFAGTDVEAHLAGAPLFGEEAYLRGLHRQAAALGIAGQVRFHGHVDDVAAFVESVDVLVHASIRPEPLGQTVLQGLAYGRPVVATDGGGPAEWITPGVNGLLVAPDRPDELAAALRSLAGSAELRAALAAGAARTPGVRTDAECAAAHADFFRRVWSAQR
ncbi:glycosyltransferase [Spirilliplanes yamanashiensis]|uniref:Glycosyl transferase n=1 Tax=Spirilliplanes yamanashiensis TaxID=42233 RepID=A0A8J3Y6G8_9ACTN|nr:glycosyltransferase [Spirilliplanes yamanashiensis]MDP9814781.1 glycosyltransferase involved in cell wall biosynthesis [Spirilliplanes yamanashiensis]GIJ02435.1 glycosyl transferase [Spirilliplanes yamanashiensis]